MYMGKEKLDEIKKKHDTLLLLDSDVDEAFEFVWEVLTAEADALKKRCAYATQSIAKMESAAHQVFEIQNEIGNEEFGDEK